MPLIEFANQAALWGLLLLVPVILLYLLKPKPKHVFFPSVMFIMKAERSKRMRSILKRIVRDPLLLIQLILIALLVSAASQPFFFAKETEDVFEDAVIIFDSSASMKSSDVSPDRFGRAVDIARGIIGRMNDESSVSIVLAENVPILLAKGLGRDDAIDALDGVFCSDAPGNVGDAILFSRNLLPESGRNRRIYVLSDLASMEGADLRLSERIVSRDNISVDFVEVNGGGGNLGIVELSAKRFATDKSRFFLTFNVQNFFGEEREVEAGVYLDGSLLTSLKGPVPASSERLYVYEGTATEPAHRITVRLKGSDYLSVDDTAYAFLPEVRKYQVLLVTDEGKDTYLKYALQSSGDVELSEAVPPVIPDYGLFDVVITGELKKDFILPGTFRELDLYVEDGGHAVFLASENLPGEGSEHLDKLLPVNMDSGVVKGGRKETIGVLIDHGILADVVPKGSGYFPNIVAERYIECGEKNGSTVIARIRDSPAIAFQAVGGGRTVYVGLNPDPEWSNFYQSSSFPIFWLQLLDWVSRDDSTLGMNNFRTGEYLPFVADTVVRTPSGRLLDSTSLVLDEAGFYGISRGERTDTIAVSLLNGRESDIAASLNVQKAGGKDYIALKAVVDMKKELMPYILALAFIFFFVEVFYYKRRGLI
ncbi:MAG: VWA domain-containing protein [Candidatus Altiarchaeota archaeon]|nr:VWA domain-containing protein [Candidatus Altiarchaeota archaeon]